MTGIKHEENQLSPVKRALLEIRELRSKLEASERAKSEPIAIIGMGCRIPGGANDAASFWRLLDNGVDAIVDIPSDRWDADAFYDPDPDAPGKMSTRWGGFLDEIDKFDPDFFGISPREAVTMDPQQRLLLEVAWESLENAGQAPDKLFGSETGIFIGVGGFDYWQLQMQNGDRSNIDAYFATGITHSAAAGRLSYVLGLQGPSVAVDTACSSSLVAIHQACHSLRAGECHLALAGGVNVILTPEHHINFSKAHVLASDGRCKAFDASADGFVRSEGCGIVVLKRLSDALADNDSILAVVRGSAVNQDGRSSGLTAPNGPSQQEVIRKALANAGIEPALVQYVEAHGTGTSLGDPIEVQALAAVFGKDRPKTDPLFIGSVKTNIGHLETAAGVAGLIKLVLALQYEKIPPHLHLKELNPHIPWQDIPVAVSTEGMPWPAAEKKRFAGVSSFGFSGTNAHIVVEEAPLGEAEEAKADRPLHLLTLSAMCENALKEQVVRYTDYLAANPASVLSHVGYTANTGRSHFSHRLAVSAETTEQARKKLVAYKELKNTPEVMHRHVKGKDRREVVFLFTGQGSQYPGMGRGLFETQPTFRQTLERCDEILHSYLDESLLSLLYQENGENPLINETVFTQLALFAVEYALAELWRSWGIEPGAVIGHSVGEYVAACVAGVFSLEDGLKLISERARLMQGLLQEGMMAAVFSEEDLVRNALAPYEGTVAISAVNSPNNVVVSGEKHAVATILGKLKDQGIRTHVLEVSHAFHSPLVEPMLKPFEEAVIQVKFEKPVIPLISNLTGTVLNYDETTWPKYWQRHARETVKFASGITTLYELGYRIFLEVGPSPTLCGLGQQCLLDADLAWLPSLRREWSDWQQMIESLGELYVRGMEVDWEGFDGDYQRRKVRLPTYPFQREHYWVEPSRSTLQKEQSEDPLLVWQNAVKAGRQQSLQVPIDLKLHTYQTKWRCLARLTTSYIIRALRQLYVYAEPREAHTVDGLLEEHHILPTYKGLLSRWLKRLTGEGLLRQQGDLFISSKPLPDPKVDSRLNEARETLADIPFLQEYVERCGDLLAAVLTGKENPLKTLFPGGSSHIAESIYQHWTLSRYYNSIIGSVVGSLVRHSQHENSLRILEIGAGIGGTTGSVLPVLPTDGTFYYYFTDLSEAFFNQAERKFKAFPFVRYSVLDIERAPEEQGYGSHLFDVVIATNVLHATRDLGETLKHVESLLSPSGLLLLCEMTSYRAWLDITFGLLEGWNRFDDSLRQKSPLLSKDEWEELLRSRGFEKISTFPESDSVAELLTQHILVAQGLPVKVIEQAHVTSEFPKPRHEYVHHTDSSKETAEISEVHVDVPSEDSSGKTEFLLLLQESSPDESLELLIDHVRRQVTTVLRRASSKPVDRFQRLMDLGLDSLMAVELRNLLEISLGLNSVLPATLIFDYPTIEAIARYLSTEVLSLEKALGDSHPEPSAKAKSKMEAQDAGIEEPSDPNEIERLSDEEVKKLLLKKLETLDEDV